MDVAESKRCFNVKFSTYYCRKKMKILTSFQIGIGVPLGYCRGWGRIVAALWWALVLGVGGGFHIASRILFCGFVGVGGFIPVALALLLC